MFARSSSKAHATSATTSSAGDEGSERPPLIDPLVAPAVGMRWLEELLERTQDPQVAIQALVEASKMSLFDRYVQDVGGGDRSEAINRVRRIFLIFRANFGLLEDKSWDDVRGAFLPGELRQDREVAEALPDLLPVYQSAGGVRMLAGAARMGSMTQLAAVRATTKFSQDDALDAGGEYKIPSRNIVLRSMDTRTFLHEVGHAIHYQSRLAAPRINAWLEGLMFREMAVQEVIAAIAPQLTLPPEQLSGSIFPASTPIRGSLSEPEYQQLCERLMAGPLDFDKWFRASDASRLFFRKAGAHSSYYEIGDLAITFGHMFSAYALTAPAEFFAEAYATYYSPDRSKLPSEILAFFDELMPLIDWELATGADIVPGDANWSGALK